MIDLTVWWDRLIAAFQHPAFHAAVLALLIGLALTEALAHLLPGLTPAKLTERLIRVVVILVVIVAGYLLHPTTIGAGWAMFAGLAAPSIHHHLQAWAYARWPSIKPEALVP